MRLEDFIVCDDIRHEQGNKVSLMGVFRDEILLPQVWPQALRLGFFARFRLEPEDASPDAFSIELRFNDVAVVKIQGTMTLSNRSLPLELVAVVPMVPLPRPGVLRFRITMKQGSETIFIGDELPGSSLRVSEALA